MIKQLILVLTLLLLPITSFAQTHVSGYYRKDGTYVQPHYRSSPDSTVQNNYSYKGNANPYTGQQGSNYYRNNPSSGYYGSYPSSTVQKPKTYFGSYK